MANSRRFWTDSGNKEILYRLNKFPKFKKKSHENQISYIDNILHVDCPPNLEDSDTQVDGMLFHIEHSFHKAQSIRKDQDIDSRYMLCYLDNRYHVDIPPFVLQIILKVSSIFDEFQ